MKSCLNYNEFNNYISENVRFFVRGVHEDTAPDYESWYNLYASGHPLNRILEEVAVRDYSTDAGPLEYMLPREVASFASAGCMIIPRLINYERNRRYLRDKAYKQIEDLAVTYHVILSPDDMYTTVPVTRLLLRNYRVNIETLHRRSLDNMERLLPIWYRSLPLVARETAAGIFPGVMHDGDYELPDLYADGYDGTMVLSNAGCCYGAAAILHPGIMERLYRALGEDFYILPSSVHEVILKPLSGGMSAGELQMTVRDINASILKPDELLSDHIYRYDFCRHTLMTEL